MNSVEMPSGWEVIPFKQAVRPNPPLSGKKLLARAYREAGSYPVIDQGQRPIAGWTDDRSLVIDVGLPYVVFGDHTRVFKFVDVPFVLGADGTQLLKPAFNFDPRFFYFFCQSLEIPHRGYNRHFGLLKEKAVVRPPIDEQRRIAAILWKVQRAIEVQEQLVATVRELKQAAMRQLFTRGLRGEAQKETEIGMVPESWAIVRCDDITREITVGVVVKPASHYVSFGVPAFRSLNVREDRLETEKLVFFSQDSNDSVLSKSKLRSGDVLVVRTGHPGTSCVVPPEYDGANCIDIVIVRPNHGRVSSGFLSRFLNSEQGRSQALRSSYGLAQQHLNVGAVREIRVPLPTLAEQHEIATALQTIDRKLAHHERKRDTLHELFKTLLHELMTGRIRVHELDVDITALAGEPTGGEAT